MTDFDDWSCSADSRTVLTRWVFRPDGKWEIREQYKMIAAEHIFYLSEDELFDITEEQVINTFKEYRKTGNPVTLPIRQRSFRNQLRMTWGAFRGSVIYEFLTISKERDKQNLEYLLGANEPFGNWR